MTELPPLNALRAFESVARTGAFTAAGLELGVTSAAVSQQVRNLETYWGKKLFIRQGNRLALSEAGLAAYPAAARAMSTLSELSDTMREIQQAPSLVLSVPHSVAETWLPRKLANLKVPNTSDAPIVARIQVRTEEDPVEFMNTGAHMRIFYGHGIYSEYRVETLFHDSLIAVAAPEFLARHGTSVQGIADQYLIHTTWGPNYASSPSWLDHLPSDRTIDVAAGLRLSASSTALAFARNGFGAALVPSMMAREDIGQGRLLRLEGQETLMPFPYSLAFPFSLQNRPDVQQTLNALTTPERIDR